MSDTDFTAPDMSKEPAPDHVFGLSGTVKRFDFVEPCAEPVSTEPTIDHSAFRLECGHISDLLAHIKEWFEWRLAGGNPPPK